MDVFHVTKFPWADECTDCKKHHTDAVLGIWGEIRRNLTGYPFPGTCSNEQKIAVQSTLLGASRKSKRKWLRLDTDEVTLENALASHIIELPFLYDKDNRKKCYASDDGTTFITLNDEDHLKLKMFRPGHADLVKLWADLSTMDDLFSKSVEYSVHPQFGFLTADPQNAGTGVSFSAVLHIPFLEYEQGIELLKNAVDALGFELFPFYNLPFPIPRDLDDTHQDTDAEGYAKHSAPHASARCHEASEPTPAAADDDGIMEWENNPVPPQNNGPAEPGAFYLLCTRVAMGESESSLATRFTACLAAVETEEDKAMEREMARQRSFFLGVCTRDLANLCYNTIHTVQSALNGLIGLKCAIKMGFLPFSKYKIDLNDLLFKAVSVDFPQLYFDDDNNAFHVMNLQKRASKIREYMQQHGVKDALNSPMFECPIEPQKNKEKKNKNK